MPRKRHADPPVRVVMYLPKSVVQKTDLLLVDTATMKPRYGAWGELVEKLLRKYHAERAIDTAIDTSPG